MVIIEDDLIPILDEMYYELSTNHLEVCLIPSKIPEHAEDGGMIRVACSQNVDWYKRFCEDHPCTRNKKRSDRKDYTIIKRKNTLQLLERMIRNKKTRSKYAEYILDIARNTKEIYDQLQEQEFEPWDNQF